MLKWVQDWGLMGTIIFELKHSDYTSEWRKARMFLHVDRAFSNTTYGWALDRTPHFLICICILALFLCTGIIAFIGWPVDDVMILLSIECAIEADTVSWKQLCTWMYIHSMDPKFAKMTVWCGISHKHTVYAKYTELLKYKHYEYFIYSIISYL